MALGNLNGISKEITDDTVQRVTDLLNNGQVTVGEVSQYFSVPKDVIMQSLTGVSQGQFKNNSYTAEDADKIEKLIRTGVASTGEVAAFAGAPVDAIERHLTDIRGYTPADIANAQAGLPIKFQEEPTPDIVDDTGLVPSTPVTPTPVTPTPVTPTPVTPTPAPQVAQTVPQVATQQYATGSEIPTGLKGSELALKGGALGAIEMLDMLNRSGRADLADQYAKGLQQAETQAGVASGVMQPYAEAGTNALQQQLALSGALGQDAFNQAYQESPQMAFLREQGMRANLAAAGATGGLGGGNVQKELQRFGQGLASQGLQQQIQNLDVLRAGGQNAAGTQANIATGLGNQQLNAQIGLGQDLAGQSSKYGLPAAQQIGNLGINLATGRTNAGQQLANQYGAAATALSNVYSGQGANLANMLGGQTASIIDQRNAAAMNEARAQQGYGADMANIQSGIGSQIAGTPQAMINVPDYQGAVTNALSAGQLGYNITKGMQPTQQQQPYVNQIGGNWGQFLGAQLGPNQPAPQMPLSNSGMPVIVT